MNAGVGQIGSSKRGFSGVRTIFALMLREMATTYGKSLGGYLWAVLEPVAGIALLSAVFSAFFTRPAIGVNFPLFYATGMMPFLIFTEVSTKVSQSLNYSRPLLAYPSVTFLDAVLARFFLAAITKFLISVLVFGGILLIYKTQAVLDLGAILESFGLSCLLGFAFGVLNCFLLGVMQAWQQIWSILMRPMFIISCIFMVFDTVPKAFRDYLWYNPVVHVVGLMRQGFYPMYRGDYISPLYVTLLSLVVLAFGLLLLLRHHRMILNET